MLIFVRHGRTRYNAEGRLQGQFDSPLDEVGWQQATALGEHLRSHYDVAHVISSSLTRTRQTAEGAGLAGAPTTIDDRWREIDFGAYDSRKIAEVNVNLGAKWLEDIEWTPTDGAESMGALHRRVAAALDDVVAVHRSLERGQAVVVISHATPIKSALAHAAMAGPQMIMRLHIGLGSISTVSRNGSVLVLSSFNERPFPPELR